MACGEKCSEGEKKIRYMSMEKTEAPKSCWTCREQCKVHEVAEQKSDAERMASEQKRPATSACCLLSCLTLTLLLSISTPQQMSNKPIRYCLSAF